MADAVSNLAGALMCYLAPRLGDSLGIDKKALLRPIPVDSPMTGLDIPWILSFINWHKDWVRPGNLEGKGEPMRHVLATFIALSLIMAFVGCADLTTTQKGAAIGGLGGEAAGGLVGSAVHHPVAGALVGGALGAGSGALIGNQLQGQQEVQQQQQEQINRQSSELQRQREELQRLKKQGEY